jgi:hypothetical protein
MADGIGNEISVFLDDISKKINSTDDIIIATVDKYADEFYKNVKDASQKHGNLGDKYTKTKIVDGYKYGYEFEFKGNAPNGEPYEKIANVLNYGWKKRVGRYAPTHFITNQIIKLAGINRAVDEQVEKMFNN